MLQRKLKLVKFIGAQFPGENILQTILVVVNGDVVLQFNRVPGITYFNKVRRIC